VTPRNTSSGIEGLDGIDPDSRPWFHNATYGNGWQTWVAAETMNMIAKSVTRLWCAAAGNPRRAAFVIWLVVMGVFISSAMAHRMTCDCVPPLYIADDCPHQ
jgi:hypothetical protein